MGDSEHGRGAADSEQDFPESVTGVGGPVLLASTVPELGRGDVLAGRYQIEAVIGSGGSGRVMRAFDRVTRDLVALKILRPEFANDPVWTERFSRELRVGRQIQHPNVCRVFDIGDSDGHRFLSMELATGGTVRLQIDSKEPPRPLDQRIADARAVIEGVAALHAAGIVHRDLKPENILRMGDGRLVVTDFGLATDPGAGPATTVMIGTPRYMAPEVVMGEPADARADVWALGVVLHEILFGRRPDRSLVRRGKRLYTPPSLQLAQERRLADLCGRCSDDAPNARPDTAVDVSRDFQRAVLGRRSRTWARDTAKKQVAWGVIALGAVATLGLVRNRWTSSAIASSSSSPSTAVVGSPDGGRILHPAGEGEDWSRQSSKLAAFDGAVHCFSLNREGHAAHVVWGQPRRAEEIDIASGKRRRANLAAETFLVGCPQTSPDGKSLLFEKMVNGAAEIFMATIPAAQGAKPLVRGSAPRWLPNGQEFSFTLDSRHAAIFSIPTREMTVVTDNVGGQFTIDGHSVDVSGGRLATLHTTESFGSALIVHALPGLEVIGSSQVPAWARGVRFDKKGDVRFTVVDSQGFRQVVSADPAVSHLRSLGRFPGADIQDALEMDDGALFIARKRRFDLWQRDRNGRVSRVTSDGRSLNGSSSASGGFVLQRLLPDARDVIIFHAADGHEEQVTEGPNDLTPSFLPDGAGWLYVKLNSGQIMECAKRTRRCVPIHADPLIPAYPTVDPSGERIAYITSLNASRVRVVSRTTKGPALDLGPALACGPVWATTQRLWVVVSAPSYERVWAEIDGDTGRRTGTVRSLRIEDGDDQCPSPVDTSRERPNRLFPVIQETSDLVRAFNSQVALSSR